MTVLVTGAAGHVGSFAGHVLMENRNGLVVDAELTGATGTAEERAAIKMLKRMPGRRRITVGADKGYDTGNFPAPPAP